MVGGSRTYPAPTHQGTTISASSWTKFLSFTIYPTDGEYITGVEEACKKLNTKESEEPKAETSRVLKHSSPPKLNISIKELRA